MAKKCIFCLREAKMSGEHIWSDWMGKLLPAKSRYYMRHLDPVTKTESRWQSSGLDMTTKVVCEPCNNGWMSQLENRVKAVLKDMFLYGKKVTLQRPEIELIAAFAFKTAVVADHTNPGRNPFFTSATRRKFATSLVVPAGVQMWLAMLDNPLGRSGYFEGGYLKGVQSPIEGFESYIFTYVAGFVALQVVGSRWLNPLRIGKSYPVLHEDPAWSNFTALFWPYGVTPVLWPPIKHLVTRRDVAVFAKRWKPSGVQ